VTGTAGWEAIVRGTPALVFGDPWYKHAPGCFSTKTRDALQSALHAIHENAPTHTDEQVIDYVSRVASGGYFWPEAAGEEEDAQADLVAELIRGAVS